MALRKVPVALPKLIRLGKVSAPHGLRGDLKIKCDNPDTPVLGALRRLFVRQADKTREFHLALVKPLGRGYFRIRLTELNDIQEASAMRGAIVLAAASDLPPRAANEFYYFEALGCEVRRTDGLKLGYIKESFFTGAHDVWVVEGESAEFMLPVVDEIVKAIDLERRVVTVEPVAGLLD